MKQSWQNRITRYSEERPDQLLAHPMNARIHPKAQADALRGVLIDVGIVQNIICNERTGHVLDGHLRISLALRDRQPTVPVTWVDVSEQEESLILATLDPISAAAAYDREKLDDLLRDVSTSDAAVQQLLADLAESVGIPSVQPIGAGGDDFDVDTALDGDCRVHAGDIWTLGGVHRVCCGDSTDSATVARVMDGARVNILWTDPPYNVNYEGKTEAALKIDNDNMSPVAFREFLQLAFFVADSVMIPGAVYYIAHPDVFAYEFIGATRDAGWRAARPPVVQWVKDSMVLGRGDYHSRSEPILYGWKPGAPHHQVIDRTQDNVWEISRPKSSREHPTSKPVELVTRAIANSSDVNDIVYDPFLGSGTTLIAAHRTGRRCVGLELEPRYCEVILKRAEAEGLSVELTERLS